MSSEKNRDNPLQLLLHGHPRTWLWEPPILIPKGFQIPGMEVTINGDLQKLDALFHGRNILLKYIKVDDNWGYPMDWKPPDLVFEGLIRPINPTRWTAKHTPCLSNALSRITKSIQQSALLVLFLPLHRSIPSVLSGLMICQNSSFHLPGSCVGQKKHIQVYISTYKGRLNHGKMKNLKKNLFSNSRFTWSCSKFNRCKPVWISHFDWIRHTNVPHQFTLVPDIQSNVQKKDPKRMVSSQCFQGVSNDAVP